jgi:hypothetical protein
LCMCVVSFEGLARGLQLECVGMGRWTWVVACHAMEDDAQVCTSLQGGQALPTGLDPARPASFPPRHCDPAAARHGPRFAQHPCCPQLTRTSTSSPPASPHCPSASLHPPSSQPSQRHWAWNALDLSFKAQTQRLGDIHHYAWRANRRNETVYLDPGDERRWVY